MADTLDMTKIKRQYFTIILDDGKNTKLNVRTPSKKVAEQLNRALTLGETTESDSEAFEALYEIAADILSNNKERIEITVDDVRGCLDDAADLWLVINKYYEFYISIIAGNLKN